MLFRHPTPKSLRSRQAGFTLVEIAVVVLIISALAALAMPAIKKVMLTTRANVVANDLRVFSAAFTTHSQQAGSYPPERAVRVFPPPMQGSLNRNAWLRKTPIGGHYNWEFRRVHAGTRYRAAIAISNVSGNRVTTDMSQLLAIDRRIDDGNYTTGNFFRGASNAPVFIIER